MKFKKHAFWINTFIYTLTVPVFMFFIISCNQNVENKIKSHEHIDWIIGSWKRINDKPSKQTFEKWEKLSTNRYKGFGYRLGNSDTVFKEYLQLVKNSSNWMLHVTGVNPTRTDFTFTNQTQSSFTCENKENDFPKIIQYKLENDTLKAVVSNDKMELLFNFVIVQ